MNAEIPRDLENIILKACAKLREDRYETAGQLADDLGRFLTGETTIARRPTVTERLIRWTAKRRRTMTAIVSVLAILLGASLATTGIVLNEMTKTDAALTLAKENFRETQQVVDRFGLQLDSELALIPGTDTIRQMVLSDVIEHYRSFIRRSERSEGLTENLAITLNKVASLTERVGTTAGGSGGSQGSSCGIRKPAADKFRQQPVEIRADVEQHRPLKNSAKATG